MVSKTKNLGSKCVSLFFMSYKANVQPTKKLIARCLYLNSYQCENTIQKFNPITLEIKTDYKYLIWNEGNPIHYWRRSDYTLENDQHIKEFREFSLQIHCRRQRKKPNTLKMYFIELLKNMYYKIFLKMYFKKNLKLYKLLLNFTHKTL